MEEGPASNVYNIPTAVGYIGHTPIKYRHPSVTIGRKYKQDPPHDHGLLYNLRDQTRFGRLHQPNYNFGERKEVPRERAPAPNIYNPKMDSVRPRAPFVSFKGHTNLSIKNGYPSPNTYTLQPAIKRLQKKTSTVPIKPRFHRIFDEVPAPNIYRLPSVDAYKYGRTVTVTMVPRRPSKTDFNAPPPNTYCPKSSACCRPGKSFGLKPSYKRVVYLTVEDLAY